MSKVQQHPQPIQQEMERVVPLTSSEIALLRRALLIYAKAYEEMRSKTKVQWEKEENARYVQAADALSDKLLKQSKLVPKGESNGN